MVIVVARYSLGQSSYPVDSHLLTIFTTIQKIFVNALDDRIAHGLCRAFFEGS